MNHSDVAKEQTEKNKNSYNEIAAQWNEYRDTTKVEKIVIEFASRTRPGGAILDIGCGTGFPIAHYLSEQGFSVTGFDIAENQIKSATGKKIKNASFSVCDFFDFVPDRKYDGIIAFDSLFHFPKERQKEIYRKLSAWMTPGAYLLFTHGKEDGEIEAEMYGRSFYYCSLEKADVERLLRENNLTVVLMQEDFREGHIERDLIIIAKKNAG